VDRTSVQDANTVLQELFGPKRERGRGGGNRKVREKMHSEELYTLYSSPNRIKLVG
jgi:hypothetical protein